MDSRRVAQAAVVLAAAMILVATLVPADGVVHAVRGRRVGSGPLPLADMLRNVLLFAPLGASLAWSRVGPLRASLFSAGLSGAIELAQTGIAGRCASALDLVSNVAGAGLGFALVRSAPAWILPGPRRASALALGSALAVVAVLAGTGVLLAPVTSDATLYGHRVPALEHLAPYGGSVPTASIDGIVVPQGPIPESDALRKRLLGDYTLHLEVVAGEPPPSQAAFLLITDAAQREILLVGPDREDLVYGFRTRGRQLGLEAARVRLPDALRGIAPGDPLVLEVERRGPELCFSLDGVPDCGHGFTVGDGWLLLAPSNRLVSHLRPSLQLAWIAALFAPLGFWARPDPLSGAALAAAAGSLLLAPAATALAPTPMSQVVSAGCGIASGFLCRRQLTGRARCRERSAC